MSRRRNWSRSGAKATAPAPAKYPGSWRLRLRNHTFDPFSFVFSKAFSETLEIKKFAFFSLYFLPQVIVMNTRHKSNFWQIFARPLKNCSKKKKVLQMKFEKFLKKFFFVRLGFFGLTWKSYFI